MIYCYASVLLTSKICIAFATASIAEPSIRFNTSIPALHALINKEKEHVIHKKYSCQLLSNAHTLHISLCILALLFLKEYLFGNLLLIVNTVE